MAFWKLRNLKRVRGRILVGRPFQAVREVPGMTAWKGRPTRGNGSTGRRCSTRRTGAASLDYVLILAVILPLVAISIVLSREAMGLVYEVLCVLVSWPFM
jgi:hypothetical protein